MTEPRPKLKYRIEHRLFLALQWMVRRAGRRWAVNALAAIARNIGPLTPLMARADPNLRIAFPTATREQRRIVARGMFDHFTRTAVEFEFLDEFAEGIGDHINVTGTEHITAAQAAGRGVVYVTGHFGAWEMARIAASAHGPGCALIYRAFNSPGVDAVINEMLTREGAPVFRRSRRGTLGLLRHIKRGGSAMILVDQRFTGGPALPFFRMTTPTALAAAELAKDQNALLIPVRSTRIGRSDRFNVAFEDPIDIDESGGPEAAMIQVNRRIEAWVRSAPEQYFWLHNRWGRAAAQDAARQK